jgi:deoxyribodipyrimidine photo-lyase
MTARPTIWLIRADFRLADNPALALAASLGPVVPVFVHNTAARPLGGASRWVLHYLLAAMGRTAPLVILQGDRTEVLPELAQKIQAAHVVWNAEGLPHETETDATLCEVLQHAGATPHIIPHGNLLHSPATFRTLQGGPYKVFTPFCKALLKQGWPTPLPAPHTTWHSTLPTCGMALESLNLLPTSPNWAQHWPSLWPHLATGTEEAAQAHLATFIKEALPRYATERDFPAAPATSTLSTALQWGLVSPRQVVQAAQRAAQANPSLAPHAEKFVSEVIWRDFCRHLLWHFPNLATHNWKPQFDAYPWTDPSSPHGQRLLLAWQQGQTGYPLVDAGMRELWHTGHMHNRVRMITASFLVKHLNLAWQAGEQWFWDTLLDASPASNPANWQWVAGCGADAQPFFRIFNPVTQSEKFDPQGLYIRQWCPELKTIPLQHLHTPWKAPALAAYPQPIVDHATARQAALWAYQTIA